MSESHIPTSHVVVHQPKKGYRFSLEPFLLSSFVHLGQNERVIDLGSGVGIIGLLLASRYRDVHVTGIEIQKELHDLAIKNIQENGLSKRLRSIRSDFRQTHQELNYSSFSLAVSNPPFHPVGRGRLNPAHQKSIARHEIRGGARDVISVAGNLLGPRGRLALIYPAPRADELLILLKHNSYFPRRMRFIRPRKDEDAALFLLEAQRSPEDQLTIHQPLILHRDTGEYTPELKQILAEFSRPN
jgi:tRNA1Val (adenine37-N6)-methyltransferase